MLEQIESKLADAFRPERLEVVNESQLHAGHGSGDERFDGQGVTHVRVRILAAAFAGMSRLERHRAINGVLQEELAAGLHALALEVAAPGEALRGQM